jgi:hypothetical protein
MKAKVGRTKRLSMFALVLMLLSVPIMSALAAGILNLPLDQVSATHGAWMGGTMGSTIDVTLSGVPGGYDVEDGAYPGWCIEDNHMDNFPPDTLFTLYDSTDASSLPATYAGVPWDKVNYLLNHRNGSVEDVQVALWLLTGTYNGTFLQTAEANAMFADANANGSGFVPGPGQVAAVILFGDGIGPDGFQDTLIEVPREPPPPPNGEGCTPGYWKQKQHFDSWSVNPPGESFSTVFGVDYDMTLLEALKTGGGGEKALGRHATAAYLNALSPDVAYYYSVGEIINIVQGAYATGEFETAKDLLEAQNDPTFCPLN